MALRASAWSWPMLGLRSSLGAYEITWPGLTMGWGKSVLREVPPISWQGLASSQRKGQWMMGTVTTPVSFPFRVTTGLRLALFN